MIARLAAALLALVVIAWLAFGYRSVVLGERGERLASAPDLAPQQVREAERLLERARLLNPDTRPLLVEGSLLAANGRYEEGIDLIERALRREPDNVVAWGVLADATARRDPERSREARARVRRLSPPVEPG